MRESDGQRRLDHDDIDYDAYYGYNSYYGYYDAYADNYVDYATYYDYYVDYTYYDYYDNYDSYYGYYYYDDSSYSYVDYYYEDYSDDYIDYSYYGSYNQLYGYYDYDSDDSSYSYYSYYAYDYSDSYLASGEGEFCFDDDDCADSDHICLGNTCEHKNWYLWIIFTCIGVCVGLCCCVVILACIIRKVCYKPGSHNQTKIEPNNQIQVTQTQAQNDPATLTVPQTQQNIPYGNFTQNTTVQVTDIDTSSAMLVQQQQPQMMQMQQMQQQPGFPPQQMMVPQQQQPNGMMMPAQPDQGIPMTVTPAGQNMTHVQQVVGYGAQPAMGAPMSNPQQQNVDPNLIDQPADKEE